MGCLAKSREDMISDLFEMLWSKTQYTYRLYILTSVRYMLNVRSIYEVVDNSQPKPTAGSRMHNAFQNLRKSTRRVQTNCAHSSKNIRCVYNKRIIKKHAQFKKEKRKKRNIFVVAYNKHAQSLNKIHNTVGRFHL